MSEGAIVIRDRESQAQEVSGLSRDVAHANQTLSPIFDKEKEQNRLQEAQLIGEIGSQAADIARTEGQIRATNAGKAELAAKKIKEPGESASREEWARYNEKLTATAAVQGLAGGNLAQAASGAAAPYLAEVIHDMTTTKDANGKEVVNVEANLMAHAVVGAVTAYAAGNSALAGASGAAMGEYIAQQMYPGVDRKDLTEEQRQTISALGTLAGGVAGDSTAGAVAGAQAGRNAAENNHLKAEQIDDFAARAKGYEARGDCGKVVKEMEALSLKQQQEMIAVCSSNPSACKEKYGDIPANGMLVREAIDRVLSADVPSKMKNDMSSLLAQQIEAEGVVSSTEFANKLKSRYGIDSQQADLLAAAALGAVTGEMGRGGKSEAGKNIVVVDSGKKGAWNKTLNKPEPNTVYKVDGNKTYHTDELSRTTSVSATLGLSKNDRNGYQQCKAGKCGNTGDEGGHLIASIFNGPGEKLNLVPMDGNLNKDAWKSMENSWANALKDGKNVEVSMQPIYSGNNIRPERVIVKYSIDGGGSVNVDFKNSPGGK